MTTYTTEAIACGLSDVAGWLENEGGRDKHARTIRLGVERLRELERLSAAEQACLSIQRDAEAKVESFNAKGMPSEAWLSQGLAIGARRCGSAIRALGTGEGSGGASASPSGHSRAEPFGLGASPECPSRDPWDSGVYDFASSVASKVAALTWAWADTADEMDDRYADVQGVVDAELRSLTGDMTAGEIYRTPAPCDGSGAAGETEGLDPKGDSAVTEGQAPSPLPHPRAPNTLSEVEEARAFIGGLLADDGPPYMQVSMLRYRADLAPVEAHRNSLRAKADRIEAALATLRASQEQDGEVRDA